jgi:hypothetical protein
MPGTRKMTKAPRIILTGDSEVRGIEGRKNHEVVTTSAGNTRKRNGDMHLLLRIKHTQRKWVISTNQYWLVVPISV